MKNWVEYYQLKGYSEEEARKKKNDLIRMANHDYEIAKNVMGITFDEWCECIVQICDAFDIENEG